MYEPPLRLLYRRLFKPHVLRLLTARQRALPDFLLIGAMRAGTTTLHGWLCQHPQIVPAIKKEIHYFDLNHLRGENWYRAHFPRIISQYTTRHTLTGEASPYYLSHPHAARRAAMLVPDAKLIVVLRNPVDRAYSHYWHGRRKGYEPLPSFEAALEAEPARLEGERARMLGDENYYSFEHHFHGYVTRSIYIDQLKFWLGHFPREQLLILENHTLHANAARMFDFLGLPPATVKLEWSRNRAQYPAMNPVTRAKLTEQFKSHNHHLFDFIDEGFPWN